MKTPRQLAAAICRRCLSPFVPERMRLPFLYWLLMLSGGCGPDLAQVDKFFVQTGTAIDIGANEGLYTYRFSKRFRHVHSFEINPDLASSIVRYNPGNVELHSCGLSSTCRSVKFYIPVINGIVLTTWGSLDRGNCPNARSFIEKDLEVKPLDHFGIAEVDFIKIDVEGHEIDVLNGGAATIEKSRPVMLIEVRTWNLPQVRAWFESRDYKEISIGCLFDLEECENYVFVPAEKLSRLGISDELSKRAAIAAGARPDSG